MSEEELVKKLRNEYFRNWRKNNKDKVKAINQKYWKKKYIKIKEVKKDD